MSSRSKPDDLVDRAYLDRLSELGERYRNGDGDALVWALHLCAREGIPQPQWLAVAVMEATARYLWWEAADLGEAFGIVRPKGAHREAKRKEMAHRLDIYARIENDSGPKDEFLFEAVGEEFGYRKSKTAEIYYSTKAQLEGDNWPHYTRAVRDDD